MAKAWNPLEHHRGPFRLQVGRPVAGKKAPWSSETLRGTTAREDVEAEAHALLTDPRDSIDAVYVFSVPEQKLITIYRKEVPR